MSKHDGGTIKENDEKKAHDEENERRITERWLSMEENIALARHFVQGHFVSKGMIADLAVHEPDKENGIPHPHFHILNRKR